jgi:polyisoprenoid-binding protein YceI
MKQYKVVMLAAVLLGAAGSLMAQSSYQLSAYAVTINGTSNLHNWNEKAEKISGKGDVKQNADKSFTLQSFSVAVPVKSIKSDEGSIMDNKTYNALKAGKFPEIIFSLTEPLNVPDGANSYAATAKGRLTIAGATRAVTMPVKITIEDKKITVEGVQVIKMTDFGTNPPTAMLGMLKVGDQVSVSFKAAFSMVNFISANK